MYWKGFSRSQSPIFKLRASCWDEFCLFSLVFDFLWKGEDILKLTGILGCTGSKSLAFWNMIWLLRQFMNWRTYQMIVRNYFPSASVITSMHNCVHCRKVKGSKILELSKSVLVCFCLVEKSLAEFLSCISRLLFRINAELQSHSILSVTRLRCLVDQNDSCLL